ncbi:MAG: hypothetical protein LBC79_07145 [Deltaproteobacteria bacterium]|jgi:hypothetical protein|nr:hypothetical protein [Deltaproteobacteria bacterium]
MGKILQIRVSAWTYDESEAERAWPRLTELAFSVPLTHHRRGVLEMVAALDDGLRFMDWPAPLKGSLAPGLKRAIAIRDQLEGALADWDPRRANKLTDELEDALDAVEASCTLS